MSALRDELLAICERMERNCVARAETLDRMTEILERKYPVDWSCIARPIDPKEPA